MKHFKSNQSNDHVLFSTFLQVVIMNITDKHSDYAKKMCENLKNMGIRVNYDLRNEKIGFKIREQTLSRVPYLLVVGDKEMTDETVSVRTREGDDLGSMSLDTFYKIVETNVSNFSRID